MAGAVANPYVGPRTFTYAEQDRFFGREREARDLLSLVISERLVLFYAQSGAGKSSLINTRLVPQLKQAGYAVLPVARVGGELPTGVSAIDNIFLLNLLLHLDQREGDPSRFAHMTLADFLARLTSPDGESYYYDDTAEPAEGASAYEELLHVLIIDQFEEIVTTHLERWQERAAFFRHLEAAMAADPLLWVVLTLREDYVAALDPYARLVSNRLRARFYMQRMGYEAALEAVRRPAEQYGRPFALNVAEALVDNLRQIRVRDTTITRPGQFVEPVQLQVVCYQLWENLKNRHTGAITMQDLQQSGDVDTALASFYEEAIASVLHDRTVGGASEIAVRNWFDQQLITEAGTRGMVYLGETHTAGLPNGIVKLIEDRYMLRSETRSAGVWYELVHDRFVEPIVQANRAWWAQQRPLMRDAQAWQEANRDKGKLYLGQQLQEALASVAQSAPEPVIAAFLNASEAEQQALEEQEAARQRELVATRQLAAAREQTATALRRRARILVGVMVTALIAAVAAVWFGIRAEQAKVDAEREKNRAQNAQEEALRGQSLFLADLARQQNEQGQYTLAALLALEALPKSMDAPNRPYVLEAEPQLYTAVINSREKWIFAGHLDQVWQAAFSPDGRWVVTASRDKTARLWDAANGELQATLAGHQWVVWQAAFSPDGRWVVTASEDKTARLWDAATGELRTTLTGHQGGVRQAAFSPDGRWVVTASRDKTARLWDAASGELRTTLTGHQGTVQRAAFSPDGRWVVTASEDKTARLWDAASGELRAILTGHQGTVWQAAFSPDGRWVVTASEDQTARLWDAATGELRAILTDHQGVVWQAAFSPDGRWVVTASRDKTARLWDAASGELRTTLTGHQGSVRQAAFSPDGRSVVTASDDKTARLWDAASGELRTTLADHQGVVWQAAFSPDGRSVVTASRDDTARLWDAASGELRTTLTGHLDQVWQAAFSPDGRSVVTASRDDTARLWDAASGELRAILTGHQGTVWQAAFSPDGRSVVTASKFDTARLWDAASGALRAILTGHQGGVSQAAFSPDGRWVVTASRDKTARLWDAASGELRTTLTGHESEVTQAAFSPDGRWVVTASRDKTARLWDAASGALRAILTGHQDTVSQAAFSPDGRWVATASEDKTARLWDATSGELRTTLTGHESEVTQAAFSPDGRSVVTASWDNTARLWDAASGELRTTLTGHQGGVWEAAFSPDGRSVVTASEDMTARLWDAASGVLQAILAGHQGRVRQAAFSPDGRSVVTASEDKTARLWRIFSNTQELIDYAERIIPRMTDGKTIAPRTLTPEERKRFFLQ